MNTPTIQEAHAAWLQADDELGLALRRVYGDTAGTMRYLPRQWALDDPSGEVRAAAEAVEAAERVFVACGGLLGLRVMLLPTT